MTQGNTNVAGFQDRPPLQTPSMPGTPTQIAEMAASGVVEFAIATEAMEHFEDLVMMPCYHWDRAIIVRRDHLLAEKPDLTLANVAAQPLNTYVFG